MGVIKTDPQKVLMSKIDCTTAYHVTSTLSAPQQKCIESPKTYIYIFFLYRSIQIQIFYFG